MEQYINKIAEITFSLKDSLVVFMQSVLQKSIYVATHFDAEMAGRLWNYVVKSNLLNFIIFAAIIIYLMKKIDIKSAIKSLQDSIVLLIENTKKNKENSIDALEKAQDSVKNLDEDVKEIRHDAEKSA